MEHIKLLRPLQWIKNVFVFAPLLFAGDLFVRDLFMPTVFAAIVFSLLASAMYIFNDLLDRKQDRLHPTKRTRPLAAKTVSVTHAYVMFFILCVTGIYILWQQVPSIIVPMAVYVALNLAYSSFLKHIALVEILIVSLFYLLRILVGGFATDTFISSWLVLCVIFLTVFVVLGKRYAEYKHGSRRRVLQSYSKQFLEQLIAISAALTLVSYGIYSVLGVKSEFMVYSMFFVLLGVFRYLQLVYDSQIVETPELLVLSDKVVVSTLVGWLMYVGYIFYIL